MKWSPQHYCKQGGRETRLLIPFPQETKGHACLTSAAQVANFRELVAGSQRGFGSEYLLDGRVCLRNGSIWLQRPELLQMRYQARVSFSFLRSDNNLSRMLGFLQMPPGIKGHLQVVPGMGSGYRIWGVALLRSINSGIPRHSVLSSQSLHLMPDWAGKLRALGFYILSC